MASSHGLFVWHELMTNDMDGAKAFYGDVLGLTCADPKMPGPPYWIFSDMGSIAFEPAFLSGRTPGPRYFAFGEFHLRLQTVPALM